MNMTKSLTALLSSTLVLGAIVGSPIQGLAKPQTEEGNQSHVDMATVNVERIVKALIAQGKLDENASQADVDAAVKRFIGDRHVPHGLDENSSLGKKLAKSRANVMSKAAKKVSEGEINAKFRDVHKDNIVVALIEFPDKMHNGLKRESDSIWTKDFSHEHYDNMLFNPYGYRVPEGIDMVTMAQYYYEASGGSWTVDGAVTPWMTAQNNQAYYGKNDENGNDPYPRELVGETLEQVGKSIAGQEAKYDQRDPYDIDGDGNVMEPDGMLDNLMLVHSGVGEETGEDADAIWSHRWTLKRPTAIPGTTIKAFDYMIQPEDGAPGVFAHEYGHNLGLPDLYDTTRQGKDSPVGAWSLMSSGSHTGYIFQTRPTGFDPWSKMFLQEVYGGNWINPTEIDHTAIKNRKKFKLNEAVNMNPSGKALKINMPDVEKVPPIQPLSGKFSYFSDEGDNLDTKMTSDEIDLTGATKATLRFDSWREIETGYDYLHVNVIDVATGDKSEVVVWDDTTDGKVVAENFDISAFAAGKKIKVEFNYITDGGLAPKAFYVDNIVVEADGQVVFSDDAEGEKKFDLDGFVHFDGKGKMYPAYYVVELRSHNGVDQGLKYFRRMNTTFTYDPGIVIWYYDGRFSTTQDNNTSQHPGYGLFGVVDAHQEMRYWNGDRNKLADARYQVNDAAFGFAPTSGMALDYIFGKMTYASLPGEHVFFDGNDYTMPEAPEIGKVLPQIGLKVVVKDIAQGFTNATIELSKSKK